MPPRGGASRNVSQEGGVRVAKRTWKINRKDFEFTLYELPHKRKGSWQNFKLEARPDGYHPGYLKKHNWWMGWNGEFAFGHDMGLLKEHQPEVHQWVIEMLFTLPAPTEIMITREKYRSRKNSPPDPGGTPLT